MNARREAGVCILSAGSFQHAALIKIKDAQAPSVHTSFQFMREV
jgi:hypothetical protein